MKQGSRRLLLLVLTVVLLLIVSSRVSPGDFYGSSRYSLSDEEERWSGDNERTRATEEPLETEEPITPLREIFPDTTLGDWNIKLINNDYAVSTEFIPTVVEVRDGYRFDARAADALEELMQAAEAAGYTICIRDAYRSYPQQAAIFYGRATVLSETQNIEYAKAEEMTRALVSYPGTSDHQTALGVDLMDSEQTDRIAEEVEDLPVLLWLQEHGCEYGFILRYPKDKQAITDWYEPWHFRYVGKEIATYMYEHNICLEEFYAQY